MELFSEDKRGDDKLAGVRGTWIAATVTALEWPEDKPWPGAHTHTHTHTHVRTHVRGKTLCW